MKGKLYFGYKDNFVGDYAAGNDAVRELIVSKDKYEYLSCTGGVSRKQLIETLKETLYFLEDTP